jgi:hypothetical protein
MSRRVVALSPELVTHAHRMWFVTKSAVEVASQLEDFAPDSYNLKHLSGWFATVFGLLVKEYTLLPCVLVQG